MIKVLEIFIDTVIVWIVEYFAGRKLLEDNRKKSIIKITGLILIFSLALTIVNVCNFEIYYGVLKISCNYLLQTLFFKLMFDKTFSKSMITALVWYLCTFVSEISVALIASIVLAISNQSLGFLKNTVFINSIILGMSYLCLILVKDKLIQFVKSDSYNKKVRMILNIIILITLALLAFKIPVDHWKFNSEFLATMIILLSFVIISLYLVKQQSDIQKTSNMYQQVVKYSNTTNKVLEDYRMINHEHKNQLSIIRQMISKEKIEVIEYIDNLIDKKNIQKYKWVSELNKLPSNGLKGLINYKFIEMEDSGISSIITISKEVSNVKLEKKLTTTQKDHLYSICGVYLDNAIQAAIKSKTKEITIDIYKEKKDLVFIIANTYKGKIDLERIDDYGYTTKGKNHGVGLHIVKSILAEDTLFSQSRKLIDKYYVQELRIHTDRFKNKRVKK